MPANSIFDMDTTMVSNMPPPPVVPSSGPGMDDQRALELALELLHPGAPEGHYVPSDQIMAMIDAERANKRSQNMTECVPVPSSEHVAEIVGRQGCKIKALRAKTNTYIKTPVRGEEPVFVVTGRKEDVINAKREILSAADHFSQIRACRKNNLNGSMAPGPPTNIPGQVTISVRVPYRVVGLVVGPKGATIKRIQQQTQTYIVTPSRDKEPVFEVTGMPESVEAAKKEIEAHIAMRTGAIFDDESALAAVAAANNLTLENLMQSPEILTSLYRLNQGNNLPGNVNSSSLNALLSSAGNSSISSVLSPNLGINGLSNGQYNGLPNGLGTSGLAQSGLGVNSLTNGLAALNNAYGTALNNTGSASNNSLNSLTNGFNALSNGSLNNMGLDLPALNGGNGVCSSNNLGLQNSYQLNGNSTVLNQINDMNSFNILGDTTNNLFSATSRTGMDPTAANLLASLRNSAADFQSASVTGPVISSMYGVDEGLGSLGSSMGSSPALEQPAVSQTLWDSKFQNLSNISLGLSGHNFATLSGDNTPVHRMSPPLIPHSPARRSNSDTNQAQGLVALSSALSALSTNSSLQASPSASSSDLQAFTSAPAPVTASASAISTSCFQAAPGGPISQGIGSIVVAAAAAPTSECTTTSSSRRGSPDATKGDKMCLICQSPDVAAAFVPCGHNQFCMKCAKKLKDEKSVCPTCHLKISEVIRILS